MSERYRAACALLVLVLLGAVACGDGDDGTSPSDVGRVDAVVRDHPGTSSAAVTPGRAFDLQSAERAAFSGTLVTNANAAISVDGTTWVDLGSPNGITINLQSTGDSTTVHGEVDAPARTYTRVRLILRETRANIAAGGSIPGFTFTSAAQLTIGGADGQVVIEKQVQPFTVSASATTRIVFELNSEAWVTLQNAQDQMVDDAEVQQSSSATTRTVART